MIFGTDGVRGLVDSEINSQVAYNIGKGTALYLHKHNLVGKVVIGKDTRLSSDCYVSALASGLSEYGIDVDIVGIVSTPMISFFVNRLDYISGIMVTASHNSNEYNGIKVFNKYGEKANEDMELEIENNFDSDYLSHYKGKINYNSSVIKYYFDYLHNTFQSIKSKNLKIAIDCANGSNYYIAPLLYKKLGFNVEKLCCNNDGKNINNDCGANYISNLVEFVSNSNSDYGIAFDGDGDRLRVVLNNGRILTGDELIYLYAIYLKEFKGKIIDKVAGTIMTNCGLDESLNMYDISVIRSDVGDKKVVELMQKNNCILGGESSGHICFLDYLPTCDALYNSLFFMMILSKFENNLIELLDKKITYPSVQENINVTKEFRHNFDNNLRLHELLKLIKKENIETKIIVRPSGTEPVIRIYVEGKNNKQNKEILLKIANKIKTEQV